jgi:hypothetical protein
MPNAVKYNVSAETLALKKGNFWIGTGDVGKGPTSSTGFYNGISPSSGGFTIYLNKESGGPSIYTVSNEAQLTALTNSISVSTNLIKNNNGGNFANGTLTPFNGSYGTLPTIVDITNDKPYNGSISTKAAKFVVGGGMSIYSDPSPFTMTVGVTYTFSFWYKLTNSNQTDVYFQNQGGSGDMNGSFFASSPGYFAKPTQTWQRCSLTFTNVVNKIYFIIALTNSSAGSELLTTEFTLTEGRVPSGPGLATSGVCLNWFATQTDKMIFNRDYEGIITNGLIMNMDAGFAPSYPTIGTTWYNLGLSGNNGTLINGPTFNTNDGGSIVCDGVDDYVVYSTATLTTFTIDITYSPLAFNTNPSNNRYNYILGSFGSNIFCRYNSLNSGNNILLSNHSGADIGIGSLGHVVNGIYNIVITFDDSTKNTKVFINSSLVRETTYNATLKYQSSITLGDTFNSKFLNHRVYDRVLTNSEILQNYYAMLNTRMIVTNGLVLNLQAGNLNSYTPGSNMWNDMSGYGNNFTLINNPTFNTSNGGYLQFDGADDYAYLTVNSSISVGTSCSLEMVVKNDYAMRMGQGGSYWAYGFEGAGFSHTCGGNGNISPYFIGDGFHHYVFTWNQAQNNHSMYRDGTLVYSFTPTCGFNAGGGGFFVLGGARGNNGFQSYGSPHIATLRLYNRILTDTEVVQNSNIMKTQFKI